MSTLGRLAFVVVALPLLGQQKAAKPLAAHPPPAEAPKPLIPKPALPAATPTLPADAERIDKRRERMKDRDAEIDRMMKEKAKQQR